MPDVSGRESEFLFLFLCALTAGSLRGIVRFALRRVLVSVHQRLLDREHTPDRGQELVPVKRL